MKISWGYKIFLVYMAFVAGILFLVYKANQQKFDLVTEDYYGAEIKYQDVINEKSNLDRLSSPPVVSHSVEQVKVQLPGEFSNESVKGEVYLYRPSDASKDIHLPFSVVGNNIFLLLPKALSGRYELKLSFVSKGKNFYNEQKIFF
jgi:hypothetical protein